MLSHLQGNWAMHSPAFQEYRVGPRGQLKSRVGRQIDAKAAYLSEITCEFREKTRSCCPWSALPNWLAARSPFIADPIAKRDSRLLFANARHPDLTQRDEKIGRFIPEG
jgi:hypothetical protein